MRSGRRVDGAGGGCVPGLAWENGLAVRPQPGCCLARAQAVGGHACRRRCGISGPAGATGQPDAHQRALQVLIQLDGAACGEGTSDECKDRFRAAAPQLRPANNNTSHHKPHNSTGWGATPSHHMPSLIPTPSPHHPWQPPPLTLRECQHLLTRRAVQAHGPRRDEAHVAPAAPTLAQRLACAPSRGSESVPGVEAATGRPGAPRAPAKQLLPCFVLARVQVVLAGTGPPPPRLSCAHTCGRQWGEGCFKQSVHGRHLGHKVGKLQAGSRAEAGGGGGVAVSVIRAIAAGAQHAQHAPPPPPAMQRLPHLRLELCQRVRHHRLPLGSAPGHQPYLSLHVCAHLPSRGQGTGQCPVNGAGRG